MGSPSAIEKESLEAHVELCAIRYSNLEHKLSSVEHRMDKLEAHLIEIKESINANTTEHSKQQVSVLTAISTVILAALLGYIGSGLFG